MSANSNGIGMTNNKNLCLRVYTYKRSAPFLETLLKCSKALFTCSDSSLTSALAVFLFLRVMLPVRCVHDSSIA